MSLRDPYSSVGEHEHSSRVGVDSLHVCKADVPRATEKLRHSRYGSPDSLDHITKRFDETTKRLFRDRNEMQFVPFGSTLDKDQTVGIRGGQLKLTG